MKYTIQFPFIRPLLAYTRVCITNLLLFAGSLALPFGGAAQTDTLSDPDAAFRIARELAFNGQRQQGRDLALRLTEKYPAYLDIKTFVGRTYAWDGNYEAARPFFATVAAAPQHPLDNFIAWSDAERWGDFTAKALSVAEKGLSFYKDDPELLYRKAKLLSLSGKMAEAKLLAQKVLRKQPKHGPAYILVQELRSQLLDNEIAVGYSFEEYARYYTPAHFAYVQASRTTPLGSVIARLNYANRFGKNAFQPEVELYPRIFRGVYGYLNYGYSDASLFPKHRLGAEVFASLPHSLEASAGMRHLSFSPTSKVTIYTGSLGYYTGNYWLSLRPYVTPDSASSSVSASLTVRRYLKSPEHFFAIRMGAGFSPELLNTQTVSGLVAKQFYTLKSQTVSLTYQQPLSKRWTVNGSLTAGRQQTLFDADTYSGNVNTAISLRYRYR